MPRSSAGMPGMVDREALDVGLVDDGVVERRLRSLVVAPIEGLVDHHVLRHVRSRVRVADLEVCLLGGEVVAEHLRAPVDVTLDRLGVGIEHQLGGVEAVAPLGVVGTVHPVAVALPRLQRGDVAVPHVARFLGQLDERLVAVVVEQAQLDALGVLREQGEIDPRAIPCRAERVRGSGPEFHGGGDYFASPDPLTT